MSTKIKKQPQAEQMPAINSVNENSLQCDLVFDLMWPAFESDQDLMVMNVLINFHEDRLQNVACRVELTQIERTV